MTIAHPSSIIALTNDLSINIENELEIDKKTNKLLIAKNEKNIKYKKIKLVGQQLNHSSLPLTITC